jgi:hypothetical protein
MLVGFVVVEDQMDLQVSVNGLIDPVEKPQELLMPVPRLAFPDHCAFEHVRRSERRRRTVAFVIVRLPLGQARTN